MSRLRLLALTVLALLAFAGNSLLCRAALRQTSVDPATFTAVRIASGALALGLLAAWRRRQQSQATVRGAGSWRAAIALLAYAASFSYAYLSLSASTGALLLFGSVQATMIGWGFWRGERLRVVQGLGLVIASGGLLTLLWPGLSAPPWQGTLLMTVAGVAWGAYSLLGRGAGDPLMVTAGNFRRAAWPAIVLALPAIAQASQGVDAAGLGLALASGALTSGIGYAIWYAALPHLKATQAATAQLGVPVIASLAAVPLLGESMTARLVFATLAVVCGIALAIVPRRQP